MYDQANVGPLRPPSEAYSLLIRVTRNCPWNRCEFCSAFKGQRFGIRTVEEVKEDIRAARSQADAVQLSAERYGQRPGEMARLSGVHWIHDDSVKNVFLQDADSLVMKTDQLVEILVFLREMFPTVERICSYARAKTIFRKSPAELARLREAGLSRLHIGLETGDDELLAYIQKGATAHQMVEAGRKAMEAGFEVSEYVMPGLGGRERWQQHARNSSRVLNEINPHFIRLRSFHPVPGTPIYEKARRGDYQMQSIEGLLLEVRQFIEELEVTSELVTSDFASNYYMGEVDGRLPDGKVSLLTSVDKALAYWRSRGEPAHSPFRLNLR